MKVPSPLAASLEGQSVYLVGGAVRDHLLGRPVADFDLVVEGDPLPTARKVGALLGKRPFPLGKGEQTVYRIVNDDTVYDFSRRQGETLEADLARRDFTINAMAYDLTARSIVDPLGGRADIQARRIRLASPQALAADPLRMLRAFRFAAVLGFDVPADLRARIAAAPWRVVEAAGERITAELFKLMAVTPSTPYLRALVETGVLPAIIPEIKACSGCTQGAFHDRDVLTHLLDTYEALEGVLTDTASLWPSFSGAVAAYLEGGDRTVLLKWAALLHDVGKPAVRRRDEKGRIRFIGHEAQGVRILKDISYRLRFPQRHEAYIGGIVEGHHRVAGLFEAHERQVLSDKALVRFIARYGEDVIGLLIHAVADRLAKAAVSRRSVGALMAFGNGLLDRYFTDIKEKMSAPPLVTGYDLMRCFHLVPSRQVGRLLNRIESARLEGRIATPAEAIRLAREILEMEGDAGIEPATPSSGGLCSIR